MILRSLTATVQKLILLIMVMLILPTSVNAEDRVNEVEYIKSYDTTSEGKDIHRIEVGLKRSNIDYDIKIAGELSSRLILDINNTVGGKAARRNNNSVDLSGGDVVSIKEIKVNFTRLYFVLPIVLDNTSYKVYTEKKPYKIIIDIDKEQSKRNSQTVDDYDYNDDGSFNNEVRDGAVVIDAGHGGGDTGASGGTGLTEANVCLSVATKVERMLTENGIPVIMTRKTDRDVSYRGSSNGTELQARVDKVPPGAAVFVSIHCNAFSNRTTHGMETYYYWNSSEGRVLAQILNEELERYGGRFNRGVKGSNFYVLKHARIPAASLVELAFITNPVEESLLADDYYQEQLAKAITQGIKRYIGK